MEELIRKDLNYFMVDDEVVCLVHGYGIVVEVTESHKYKDCVIVAVEFTIGNRTYIKDYILGCMQDDDRGDYVVHRTLFHKGTKFYHEEYIPDRRMKTVITKRPSEFKINEVVLVRNGIDKHWEIGYYSEKALLSDGMYSFKHTKTTNVNWGVKYCLPYGGNEWMDGEITEEIGIHPDYEIDTHDSRIRKQLIEEYKRN